MKLRFNAANFTTGMLLSLAAALVLDQAGIHGWPVFGVGFIIGIVFPMVEIVKEEPGDV